MKLAPHHRMLLSVGLGAALGLTLNALQGGTPWLEFTIDNIAQPIGQIFLRLLFMLVIPLLFSALVIGVSELDVRHLGRLGIKTLIFTACLSLIAVLIGLFLVNVIEPGTGASESLRALASKSTIPSAAQAPPAGAVGLIVAIIPDNAIKAAAAGDMIGLIAFSLIFGIGLSLTKGASAEKLLEVIRGLYEVSMRLIDVVLKLAPLGVGALLFSMTARLGLDIVGLLFAYVAVVLLGLSTHMFVVYSLAVRIFANKNPLDFFRGARLAIITAFSTASSNATLPTALKVAEESLHLPKHIARFVLTAGATMNQNGTALFEGVTVLFLAQLYGVDLSLGQQAGVMVICVLAGIGTAGVPSGSIPVIAMILSRYGIPVEGLGLILGVDRFLDMCRTTLNVTGDLAAAVVVSHGEPQVVEETATASG
jgi:dicarboxylate/amino acid:cation (Na+ or H+) symporter, DAACS family